MAPPPGPDGSGSNHGRRGFYDTITAAISDITEHGFDSVARVEQWIERIRRAAVESMTPPLVLERALRDTMQAIYQRMIERGGIAKLHPGVARFTIDKVKPQLRSELDRRIMASASLIKLNQAEAVEKTVQRFSGWATSVPAGGSDAVSRSEVKAGIRKSLAQLPFAERRVLIDQGHKFTSALSNIIAVDGGALAAIWHSHWRQPGYHYREDHKERDKLVYAVRGNWAIEKGLMRKGPDGYLDDITQPAEEPFCLPADQRIPFADGVEKAYRRWYSGDLTEIVTASGKSLRATPNHPVLTSNGWIAIGLLKEGDDIVEVANQIGDTVPAERDNHDSIASIAEIFGAVEKFGISKVRRGQRQQFHGDGSQSDVDIVSAAGPLRFGRVTAGEQSREYLRFSVTEHRRSATSTLKQFIRRGCATATRLMRGADKGLSSCNALSIHTDEAGFGEASDIATCGNQSIVDDLSGYGEPTGNGEATLTGQISLGNTVGADIGSERPFVSDRRTDIETQGVQSTIEGSELPPEKVGDFLDGLPVATQLSHVVQVKRSSFAGHVYNLQTVGGWYVAEGIITHNCRCYAQYVYGLRDLPADMLTEKGRSELDRIRSAA